MGLLRRLTTGKIVEDGRFSRPCGPGALSRAISENQYAATPPSPHAVQGVLVPAKIGVQQVLLGILRWE
jgi:hypothetical protein